MRDTPLNLLAPAPVSPHNYRQAVHNMHPGESERSDALSQSQEIFDPLILLRQHEELDAVDTTITSSHDSEVPLTTRSGENQLSGTFRQERESLNTEGTHTSPEDHRQSVPSAQGRESQSLGIFWQGHEELNTLEHATLGGDDEAMAEDGGLEGRIPCDEQKGSRGVRCWRRIKMGWEGVKNTAKDAHAAQLSIFGIGPHTVRFIHGLK
ncbi:hypothetical protein FRB97_009244 [Tulasnella sp. 331]|nr:hypothetical protein FRB97_009244 [Tulasnella sp. 331]